MRKTGEAIAPVQSAVSTGFDQYQSDMAPLRSGIAPLPGLRRWRPICVVQSYRLC